MLDRILRIVVHVNGFVDEKALAFLPACKKRVGQPASTINNATLPQTQATGIRMTDLACPSVLKCYFSTANLNFTNNKHNIV